MISRTLTLAFSLWIITMAGTGCSTLKSTIYDTNGCGPDRVKKRFHGAPETLEVESYLQLTVTDVRYLKCNKVDMQITGEPAEPKPTPGKPATKLTVSKVDDFKTGEELKVTVDAVDSDKSTKDVVIVIKLFTEKGVEAKLAGSEGKLSATTSDKGQAVFSKLTVSTPGKYYISATTVADKPVSERSKIFTVAPAPRACTDILLKDNNKVVTTRALDFKTIAKKELFMVDLKRPAAGGIKYKLEYEGQTFKTVNTETQDETIVRVTDLLDTFAKALPKLRKIGTATADDPTQPGGLLPIPTVVACEIFELRDPNLHERVQCFLDAYFNTCAVPCLPPIPVQMPVPVQTPHPVQVPVPVQMPLPLPLHMPHQED